MRGRGQVRIIAGCWRSRQLKFPALAGLRPSPDALRERLFAWLGGHLTAARCLDLFAGSGALGFEAASRGAGAVDMVERAPKAAAALRANAAALGAEQVYIYNMPARQFLRRASGQYDVIFLDPPFTGGQLALAGAMLNDAPIVGADTRLYVEAPNAELPAVFTTHWRVLRQGRCGQSAGTLLSPALSSCRYR